MLQKTPEDAPEEDPEDSDQKWTIEAIESDAKMASTRRVVEFQVCFE